MKKLITLVSICSLFTYHLSLFADEGMWIPILLNKNIEQMQKMGLKLTAEDIYSINQSSLKDAIVRFGRGCTGELVSPKGLLLTNHHCGYGVIQRHSSLEHDYLTDGYWAQSLDEELPNPGLNVTFMIRMEDVTDRVLEGVTPDMSEQSRSAVIKKNSKAVVDEAEKDTHYDAYVRSFYHGNQYFLIVTEIFKDIRFVGAPPSGIGKFGGDTDNWMWPRHTGDFSVFRVYADSNNQPAVYSKDNVPYKPKYYLPISLGGYNEGDFTLLFGNPGRTHEYLPSFAVELITIKENPVKIGLRQKRLDVIKNATMKNRLVRIQYSSKHARISNYWKKMIGETRGIKRADGVVKKQEFEKKFQAWAESLDGDQAGYATILPQFKKLYGERYPISLAAIYLREAGMAPELYRFSRSANNLIKQSVNKKTSDEALAAETENLMKTARSFYKNYQPAIDREITTLMMEEMWNNMYKEYMPDIFARIAKKHKGDIPAYVDDLFRKSIFVDSTRFYAFLDNYKRNKGKKLRADPVYQLFLSIANRYNQDIIPEGRRITSAIDSLQRIYMLALMKMQPDKQFYPDANSTMRVCYGQVDDFHPADAVTYEYFTTAQGILEKEDSTIYDYAVEKRLKDLISACNYGRYADDDGQLHVGFISTIHSTGGNSGAPVLNGEGELIGINFDRNWEGTMSDLMYDPDQCRNIILDIRYLLFIMDKYAGATWLVEEMDIR